MIERYLQILFGFIFKPILLKIENLERRIYLQNEQPPKLPYPYLDSFGYKVYSQNDEDGLINEIFNRIGTNNKAFVEFGVGDGLESNCHLGWRGLWIDGSNKNIKRMKEYFSEPLSTKQLTAVNSFITVENINKIIGEAGFNGEIDLLSIDIDGNELGYRIVGTTVNGVNAFFVKKELAENLFAGPAIAENFYHQGYYQKLFSSSHSAFKYIGNKYSTKL